ncbi:VWA domain-containing protein [Aeromicrobium sp. Leaf350]|uniref:VWA domain-containing protein n=1 Tax=Aeromicrobium sp. Leaf350 TaxID=2876565 RepID=UPI001E3ADE31|nr:VWA domain-containing protein [Aeromicrobium sp. Leaf350]
MRHLLAVALTALTCLVPITTVAPASAQESETETAGRLMLVLDSSGSMSELTGDGRTRIDAAKDALRAVVNQLPDDQPVGMRVFGATQPTRAGAELYCADSQNVVPVATDNRDALGAAIDDYEPYGETPIAFALQEAGKDLGPEGQRSIVLVSDGIATCEPDPCVVAEQLRAGGVDVRIDVVGLNVDAAARASLECVASAGGGTYYDATDTESLIDGLTVAQTRSARPFDLTGEPVEGTADPADAPEMAAPGQYLDALPTSGPLHYRIPRTQAGSTIHVGLSFAGESGSVGQGVRLTLYPASGLDGVSCVSNVSYGDSIGQSNPFYFGGISTWKADPEDPCNTEDEVVLEIEPTGSGTAGRPVELAVYEEPPLAKGADRDLDPAPASPTWSTLTPDTDAVDDVVPGSSLASAPLLEDGTYALDITQGETQVFAVPLDWGQSLQAQLDTVLTKETVDAGVAGSGFRVAVTGPLRTDDSISFFAQEPEDWTTTALANMSAGDPFRTGAQSPEIAYLNRSKSLNDRGPSLPGLRYVRVSFEAPQGSSNQSYTLTLATNGDGGAGAPEYDTSELSAPEADSPLVTSPVRDLDTDTTASDGGTDEGDGFPLLPVGLGAAGVLALLAAGALLARSRRASGRP